MLIKQKKLSLCRNVGCGTFGKLANTVLSKSESNILPPFNGPLVLSPASDMAKVLLKSFLRFLINHNDSGISLPIFPSRTKLKLHDISLTLKLVRKSHSQLRLLGGFLCSLCSSVNSEEL